MCKVSPSSICKIGKVPHRANGRRNDAIEKRREFEGQHRLARKVTEVPSQAPVACASRPGERFVYLLVCTRLDIPLCYALVMAPQRGRGKLTSQSAFGRSTRGPPRSWKSGENGTRVYERY
jgi:hypothetical protein